MSLQLVEVQVRQFVRGTEGKLKNLETIQRRVHTSSAHFPVFSGCCSSEVKLRSFEWVWYRNHKWQVRWFKEVCEIVLPGVNRFVINKDLLTFAAANGCCTNSLRKQIAATEITATTVFSCEQCNKSFGLSSVTAAHIVPAEEIY